MLVVCLSIKIVESLILAGLLGRRSLFLRELFLQKEKDEEFEFLQNDSELAILRFMYIFA